MKCPECGDSTFTDNYENNEKTTGGFDQMWRCEDCGHHWRVFIDQSLEEWMTGGSGARLPSTAPTVFVATVISADVYDGADEEILRRVKAAWNGHSAGLEELLSAVQLLAELADQGIGPLTLIREWGESPQGRIPYRRVMLERESE